MSQDVTVTDLSTCSRCRRQLPSTDFYLRSPGVLRRDCKRCVIARTTAQQQGTRSAYRRVYGQRHHARLCEQARSRRGRPDVRAANRQRQSDWRTANPDGERAKRRRYAATLRGRAVRQAIGARYRTRLSESYAYEETAAWRIVVAADPCSYCGRPGGEADHIVALAGGGNEAINNLVGACRSCNASKGDRPLLIWMLDHRAIASLAGGRAA